MKKMMLHQVRGYPQAQKKIRAQVHEHLSHKVMIVVEDQIDEFIYRDFVELVWAQVWDQVNREVRR